ncbi:unnamed protein product [Anisakis simplex]|uniref:DB domain-containing protein n=1 Tax=Anisakis simplex TaxID=6269 RepID=A0A0M3K8A5_ANISI|nr:unnamed protein product [Anisakis simplex]
MALQATLSILTFLQCISLSVQCAPFFCTYAMGLCNPFVPRPMCPPCSMGYACSPGIGLCVSRARKFSKLAQDAIDEDDIQEDQKGILKANKEFKTCCELSSMPDGCLDKCSYNQYNRRSAQKIALGMEPSCPSASLPALHACAARHSDHTKCCLEKSIFDESLFEKCQPICRSKVDKIIKLDVSYLPCFEQFDRLVSDCFRNYTATVSEDF